MFFDLNFHSDLVDSFTMETLQKALQNAYSSLTNFAKSADFNAKIQTAFGENYDAAKVESLRQKLDSGDFSFLPNIEVRTRAELQGANAAYAGATNTIYVSQDFLNQYGNNIDVVAAVLLEEIGHSVDWGINNGVDTPGDEGELFSALVREVNLSQEQIQQMKLDNDSVVIALSTNGLNVENNSIYGSPDPQLVINMSSDSDSGRQYNWGNFDTLYNAILASRPTTQFVFVNGILTSSLDPVIDTLSKTLDIPNDSREISGTGYDSIDFVGIHNPSSGSLNYLSPATDVYNLYKKAYDVIKDVLFQYALNNFNTSNWEQDKGGYLLTNLAIENPNFLGTHFLGKNYGKYEINESSINYINGLGFNIESPFNEKELIDKLGIESLGISDNSSDLVYLSIDNNISQLNNFLVKYGDVDGLYSRLMDNNELKKDPLSDNPPNDLLEAFAQFLSDSPSEASEKVNSQWVQGVINHLTGSESSSVILMAHSQGNFFLEDGLFKLNDSLKQFSSLDSSFSRVKVVGLGSPTDYQSSGIGITSIFSINADYERSGDPIVALQLGGDNSNRNKIQTFLKLIPNLTDPSKVVWNLGERHSLFMGVNSVGVGDGYFTDKNIKENLAKYFKQLNPTGYYFPDGQQNWLQGNLAWNKSYGNYLKGFDGWDWLDGNSGNDVLRAYGGGDGLVGGSGWDVLDGGDGIDEADYRDSPSYITVNQKENYLGTGLDVYEVDDGHGAKDVLTNIEKISGSSKADKFYGGDGKDIFYGRDGNDYFEGKDGDDEFYGGNNDDTAYGGGDEDILTGEGGKDYLYGGDGHDEISGDQRWWDWDWQNDITEQQGNQSQGEASFNITGFNQQSDSPLNLVSPQSTNQSVLTLAEANTNQIDQGDFINGGAGNDWIDGGAGDDKIYGESGDDIITGDVGNDWIEGGIGNDKLNGAEGNDLVNGDDGEDYLFGKQGEDTLHGGNGNDLISGGNDNDTISGDAGDDNISGDNGVDNIQGNTGNDTISGGNGNDLISGGDDNDTITGDAGDDNIFGDSGKDYIQGNAGKDLISGGDDDDTIQGNEDDDTIYGDNGNDKIEGNFGQDTLSGGNGDDLISGGDNNDTITGDAGDDNIFGDSGADLINGNTGNDTISGGDGVDLVYGDDGDDAIAGDNGNDTVYGGDGADTINGNNGDDYLNGNAGNDTMYGDAGNDILDGETGNDAIYGGDGDDYMIGGAGGDKLNGGAGLDISSYRNAPSGIAVSLYAGDGWRGDAAGDKITETEGVEGSEFNDYIIGSSGENILHGFGGDDIIEGYGGDDLITGGDGNDRLVGGSGNDTQIGGSGNDTHYGELGNDTIIDLTGDNHIDAGEGDNVVTAGDGNDIVYSGPNNDVITGGNGSNSLYAGEGKNRITTGSDNDVIYAGASDDIINAEAGNDLIFAAEGNNTVFAGDGNDVIYAGAGDDILNGGAGNDLIFAADGNNFINSGAGNDIINSGSGKDVFVLALGGGTDTINNFQVGHDLIGLPSGLTFDDLTITQGVGSNNEFFTLINDVNNGDTLASLSWTSASSIDRSSFTII